MTTEPVFLFCHVPRTGGTTSIDVLRQVLGADNCKIQSVPLSTDFIGHLESDIRNGVRLFAGHLPLPRFIRLKADHPNISFKLLASCRDPVAHFYSLYLHGAHFGDETSERRKLSISEFIRTHNPEYDFDSSVANVLVRYYSGALDGALSPAEYSAARRNLRQIDHIIDGSRLEESLALFVGKYASAGSSFELKSLNTNSRDSRAIEEGNRDQLNDLRQILRFDISLYSAILKRRSAHTDRSHFPVILKRIDKTSDGKAADSVTYVAEVIRRGRYSVDAKSKLFEFKNNDLFLHPPQAGVTRIRAKKAIAVAEDEMFICTLQLNELAREPVVFRLKISGTAGTVTVESTVRPGKETAIRLFVGELHGRLSFEFSTRLRRGATSSAYAWATIVAPRLVGRFT